VIYGLSTGHQIGLATVAILFIVFALVSSFVLPRFSPNFPGQKGLVWYLPLCVCFFVAMMGAILVFGKESKASSEASDSTPAATTTTSAPATTGDATAGKAVFASGGCGGCHTLKAAGATGTVGPNLDDSKPSEALVVDRVTNGAGAMPPFKGQLSDTQIQDVAAFVSSSVGS
jgi:cytochrome c553